jgi:hypothetical protein
VALRALLLLLDGRLARLGPVVNPPSRRVRVAIGSGVGALVVAVALALGGAGCAHREYDRFLQVHLAAHRSSTRERLTEPANDGRLPLWEVALQIYRSHKFDGTGAGTYQQFYARDRTEASYVTDAHSLYLQSLAELGIVGFVLIVTVVAGMLAGLGRRIRGPGRGIYAALFAVVLAWALHQALDWDWQMPAVTLPVFKAPGPRLPPTTALPPSRTPTISPGRLICALAPRLPKHMRRRRRSQRPIAGERATRGRQPSRGRAPAQPQRPRTHTGSPRAGQHQCAEHKRDPRDHIGPLRAWRRQLACGLGGKVVAGGDRQAPDRSDRRVTDADTPGYRNACDRGPLRGGHAPGGKDADAVGHHRENGAAVQQRQLLAKKAGIPLGVAPEFPDRSEIGARCGDRNAQRVAVALRCRQQPFKVRPHTSRHTRVDGQEERLCDQDIAGGVAVCPGHADRRGGCEQRRCKRGGCQPRPPRPPGSGNLRRISQQ